MIKKVIVKWIFLGFRKLRKINKQSSNYIYIKCMAFHKLLRKCDALQYETITLYDITSLNYSTKSWLYIDWAILHRTHLAHFFSRYHFLFHCCIFTFFEPMIINWKQKYRSKTGWLPPGPSLHWPDTGHRAHTGHTHTGGSDCCQQAAGPPGSSLG